VNQHDAIRSDMTIPHTMPKECKRGANSGWRGELGVSTVLITHTDLDGAVCAVLFKAVTPEVFPEGKVHYCNYDDVDETVRRVVEEEKPDNLLLTDISVRPETAEWLDGQKQLGVKLLDHHKTAAPLRIYQWAVVDESSCGAKLFWDFLRQGLTDEYPRLVLEPYENLVDLTDDWDRWLHQRPESRRLNALFHALGRDRFVARFLSDQWVDFTEGEALILELEEERKKRYVEKALRRVYRLDHACGHKEGVVCAEQYFSDLGAAILTTWPELDYVSILDFARQEVSLRSRPGGIDVGEVARKFSGGGHPGAAGHPMRKDWAEYAMVYQLLGCNQPLRLLEVPAGSPRCPTED